MTGMMPDAGMLRQLDGATRPPPIGSERAKRHLGGPPFMGANLGMSDRMMMAGPGGDGVDRGWGVIGMAGRHPGSAQQRDIQDWLHCSTNGTGGPSVTPEFAENISNLEQISNQLVQGARGGGAPGPVGPTVMGYANGSMMGNLGGNTLNDLAGDLLNQSFSHHIHQNQPHMTGLGPDCATPTSVGPMPSHGVDLDKMWGGNWA
jgi:hypothetical protein